VGAIPILGYGRRIRKAASWGYLENRRYVLHDAADEDERQRINSRERSA
jgi:hypothetical protein